MIKDDLIYNLRDSKLAGTLRRILLDAQTKLARKLNLAGIIRTLTEEGTDPHVTANLKLYTLYSFPALWKSDYKHYLLMCYGVSSE